MVNGAKPAVRITNQFRRHQAMVYELSCGDVRLTLALSAGEGDDDWHIEAFARQVPGRPAVGDSGGTRQEALRAVERAWVSKGGAHGFAKLDWEAVAAALVAVRAI